MAYFNHRLFLDAPAGEENEVCDAKKARNIFYWKRIARLAPMYYFALLWSLPEFIHQIYDAEDGDERNHLYLSGVLTLLCSQTWIRRTQIWNVPSWQISAFAWCYALLPFIAKPIYRKIGRSRQACILYIMICFVCNIIVVSLNCPLFDCDLSAHYCVASRCFHFFMGIGVGLLLKIESKAQAQALSQSTKARVTTVASPSSLAASTASDAVEPNASAEESKTESRENSASDSDEEEEKVELLQITELSNVAVRIAPEETEETAPAYCYSSWVVCTGACAFLITQFVFLTSMPTDDRASKAWKYGTWIELGGAPLFSYYLYHLCLVKGKSLTCRVLNCRSMQTLGKYSLNFYLLHWHFLFYYSYARTQRMVTFRESNFTGEGGAAKEHGVFVLNVWESIVIVPLLLAICVAAHHFIEKPCRNYIIAKYV